MSIFRDGRRTADPSAPTFGRFLLIFGDPDGERGTMAKEYHCYTCMTQAQTHFASQGHQDVHPFVLTGNEPPDKRDVFAAIQQRWKRIRHIEWL